MKKDNAKDLDVVLAKHNSKEYSDRSSKYQEVCGNIIDTEHEDDIASYESFKFKLRFTKSTGDDGLRNEEIEVSQKGLIKVWRTLQTPPTNYEVVC